MMPAWASAIEADSGLPCGWLPCGTVVPFTSQAQRRWFPAAAMGNPSDVHHGQLEHGRSPQQPWAIP